MARMKFLCDADRCIECNACVTACKNEHEVPWGINRRRVVTINDGKPGERSVSMACMHCTDAPCQAVCPVNAFYTTADGVVLHSKDICIGCGYCFYACPFGAPQYPRVGNFGSRGKMDKCTYCAGGPEPDGSAAEYEKYGANRLAEGKLPLCAEMCATKSLLAGDGEVVADIYNQRVAKRGYGSGAWGWKWRPTRPIRTPPAPRHRNFSFKVLRRPFEPRLRTLVGVVDHAPGSPCHERHVQSIEHQSCGERGGHRPANDAAAEGVEHHREIEKTRPGRDIRDIRHPQPIRH